MAYGQKFTLGFGFQNSFGTPVTDAGSFTFIQFLEEDIGLDIPQLKDESMAGDFYEGDSYEGPKAVSGTFRMNAKSIPMGVPLKSFFEVYTPTQVASFVHQHVYQFGNTDWDNFSALRPFTVKKFMDDNSSTGSVFSDLNMAQLEFNVANGQFLTMMGTIVGGTFAHDGSPVTNPTFTTGQRFTWSVGSISIAGAANADVSELTLTMDQMLEARHTINNSKYPYLVKRSGFRNATLSGTIRFRTHSEYIAFTEQSERTMSINFRGATEVQSGYFDSLTIDIARVRYTEFKPTGSTGLVEVGFGADIKNDTGSDSPITITLQNTQSVY